MQQCHHHPRTKTKMFVLGKLRGFGCKGMAMPISADAQGVAERKKNKRRKNKKKSSRKARKLSTNLADTPDICCAPPGISYLSDVIPRPDTNAQRTTTAHFQHSRVARRRESSHVNSASDALVSRHCHDLYIRFTIGTLHDEDQHRNWRLDTDGMSYEELVDLEDKIGYVNRGLCEKEIYQCLKIPKFTVAESVGLLRSTDKDWKCSICQGGYRSDKEVGQLGCGHSHHISCIKQWLRQKNECPICKIPPMAHKARLSSD